MFVNLPAKIRDISQQVATTLIFSLLMLGGYSADASELKLSDQTTFQQLNNAFEEIPIKGRLSACEKTKDGCSSTPKQKVPAGAGGAPRPMGETALA